MFALPPGRPAVMGVLNVTPDSFSDGGAYPSVDAAISAGLRMHELGADLVDVGGESTRPSAEPVSLEEELRRVLPVVDGLVRQGVPVSIDTQKAVVAREAVARGASVINDVSGFRDPAMINVARECTASLCVMHMQGDPQTMQVAPTYGDVVHEVRDYLLEQISKLEVAPERVWIDPGIGFGKTEEHNWALLRGLGAFVATGFSVVLGVSRKGFLGRLTEPSTPVLERLPAALAVQSAAVAAGVRVIRTHDVKETRLALLASSRLNVL